MTRLVTVGPSQFRLVEFDASEIAQLVAAVADRLGLPSDLAVVVNVDETTPLGRARVASVDPLVLEVESGGFEDPLRPRRLSRTNVEATAGRLLMRAADRLSPEFADAPPDSELSLAEAAAWDAYATGRLARRGYPSQRDRRHYHFRIRHGFTDAADAAFDRLWSADGLAWGEVRELSESGVIGVQMEGSEGHDVETSHQQKLKEGNVRF